MKPYTRSIIEMFDGKKRFLIPFYQRQYTWRVRPQLDLLWEDIERTVSKLTTDRASLSPHFMGAIVVAQVKTFGKQVQAFEIIDGQQRLTTFQLLLSALRDVAAENGSKYKDELQKYLINDGVMENPEAERFKLWPSLTDRRAFIGILDPQIDLSTIAPPPSDEDGFVRRAVTAHEYFKDKIRNHVGYDGKFDEDRLETLFEALKDGLAVVSIELEGGDDPQTIFETLNSRGVDLTSADLMRNFIFQRAKGLGLAGSSLLVDRLYEKHWLPLDGAFWNQLASRGRQSRPRLDWMLTDHLSMHVGALVSVDSLFDSYRRWILNSQPYPTVIAELEAITATGAVAKRLFDQTRGDPIGDFGRFAEAFDVSTVVPLVIYLATAAASPNDLERGLFTLESYILRRDICALTTKNYNKLFVGLVDRLRESSENKIDVLIAVLSDRQSDIDRWPDDREWRNSWLGRDQYKAARGPRLRYMFEAIEKAKRSALNEDIDIRSALTIEHIMPHRWREAWPIPGVDHIDEGDPDPQQLARQLERDGAINKLGNLTLLTQSLNSSVSHGAYSVKMAAVRSHSSLALNRELNRYDDWNEDSIAARGAALFQTARKIWEAPKRQEFSLPEVQAYSDASAKPTVNLPPDGTACRLTYNDKRYSALVKNGFLIVDGFDFAFSSLSSAAKMITQTSRNGWLVWYILTQDGNWMLADDWRKQQ